MKINRTIRMLLIALCAAIFVGSAAYLIRYYVALKNNSAIYENLQQVVTVTPAPTVRPTAQPTPQPTEEAVEIGVDFAALHEINPDIYAWIEIPNSEVSYPIAQHESDNAYYLNYTIEGVHGLPGSIYTEHGDARDFSDFNTVIYGHNMANDTMFGSLNNYRSIDYFNAHKKIVITTETEVRSYRVFAAVIYDNSYIPYVYDDTDKADRNAFLDSIYNNGNSVDNIDTTVSVTADSQIITLSTCIGGMPENRYLLVAVYQADESSAVEN